MITRVLVVSDNPWAPIAVWTRELVQAKLHTYIRTSSVVPQFIKTWRPDCALVWDCAAWGVVADSEPVHTAIRQLLVTRTRVALMLPADYEGAWHTVALRFGNLMLHRHDQNFSVVCQFLTAEELPVVESQLIA